MQKILLRRMSTTACSFLADRTNGRAYATVLRLSICRLSDVCDVMYCGMLEKFQVAISPQPVVLSIIHPS